MFLFLLLCLCPCCCPYPPLPLAAAVPLSCSSPLALFAVGCPRYDHGPYFFLSLSKKYKVSVQMSSGVHCRWKRGSLHVMGS